MIQFYCFLSVKYIGNEKPRVVEGELRCKQLVEYLDHLKVRKFVWLSEDATGIINKIEYDPKFNQLIGLVLPINSNSGMPISFSFIAKTAEDIKKLMEKP